MSTTLTNRRTIPEAEAIVDGYFPVLDHGFIALKDYMGGDLSIEEAARMSYGAGTRARSKTRGLLRYLLRKEHTTPFEMVELKFHVAMPIFVARQWVRQRTASLNEYSGRYSLMPMAFYTPEEWRKQSKSNNQGSSGRVLLHSAHLAADGLSEDTRGAAQAEYEWLTREDVSRELARIDLPLSTYTQWVWKIDLHNLFRFLRQRCDSHAQLEIRAYAEVMAAMVKRLVPLAFEAWVDYQFAGESMSRMELRLLSRMFSEKNGEFYPENCYLANTDSWDERAAEMTGLSKREYGEFLSKMRGPKEIPDFNLDLTQMRPGNYFEEKLNALVPKVG